MEKMSLQRLKSAIRKEWGEDTSSRPDEWSPANPARGQSVATALLIQDVLGGEIEPVFIYGDHMQEVEVHYRNRLPHGGWADLTAVQYAPLRPVRMMPAPLEYEMLDEAGYFSRRDYLLSFSKNEKCYKALMTRVMILGGINLP